MSESIRRQGQMVQSALRYLNVRGEPVPAREVIAAVEAEIGATDYEAADYPTTPGVRRFDKIVRFATISSVKAGWLAKSKGRWSVTSEGQQALLDYPEPEAFQRAAKDLYRVWRKNQPVPDVEDEFEPDDADNPATTLEEAEEAAWSEIADYLAVMPPYDFQDLVADLLRSMGYHVPWVSPPGRDGGIDIVAFTDPLGAVGPRIKVQVKRQSSSEIAVDGVRSFMALLGNNDVGLFVSIGGFTSEAIREVRGQEQRRITLIDLEALFDLWVEHFDTMPADARLRLPLRPVYFLDRQGD